MKIIRCYTLQTCFTCRFIRFIDKTYIYFVNLVCQTQNVYPFMKYYQVSDTIRNRTEIPDGKETPLRAIPRTQYKPKNRNYPSNTPYYLTGKRTQATIKLAQECFETPDNAFFQRFIIFAFYHFLQIPVFFSPNTLKQRLPTGAFHTQNTYYYGVLFALILQAF